jgi:choline dehydrogenase-like flavoprotein
MFPTKNPKPTHQMNESTTNVGQPSDAPIESGSLAGNADTTRRRFLQGLGAAVATASIPHAVTLSAQAAVTEGPEPTYDVVIIGSGISGAILAKRLLEQDQKRKVLILEAGDGDLNDRTRETSNYFSNLNKFPESPFDENVNAPSATIKDLIGGGPSYLDHVDQEGKTTRFGSTYVRKTGGTMWHWMGTCLRFMPNDFLMKSQYGRGVDWPIKYDEMAKTARDKNGLSYYDMAEDEIGVSASVVDQDPPNRQGGKVGLFRDRREYPMPALESTIVDTFFKEGVRKMKFEGDEVWVYKTPAGRNSVPYKNRPACAGNSSCVPICRIRAKYDATVTLDEVIRRFGKNVTLARRCVAAKLEYGPTGPDNKPLIKGVSYIPYDDSSRVSPGKPRTARGRIYVLAANGIETPKLMLASGMGKINDSIGRNLMDHPFFLRWGLTPPGRKIYPYRGPLSTGGLDGMRDGGFRKDRSAYRIEIGNDGWALAAGDPWRTVSKFVDSNWYGERLVKRLNDLFTRQCRIGFELEQLPDRDNRVTLSEHKDALGLFRPKVRYSFSEYENNGFRSALKFTKQLFRHLDIEDASPDYDDPEINFMEPGRVMGAGHVMGTCCMGALGKSVVDKYQCSHDFQNLFIVGSSVFPTGSTANPTLTIAALAFWAADTIHSRLG